MMNKLICCVFIIVNLTNASENFNIRTNVVHSGSDPSSSNNFAVVPPISLATTFVQDYPGLKPGLDDPSSFGKGFFYSRQANPTRGSLEIALAKIENAKHCCSFSSGLAATQAVIQLLNSGSHVIALNDLYGGTSGYFRNIAAPTSNIDFEFLSFDNIDVLEAACTPKTKLIWLESPTNPLLKTTDIRAVAALAKRKGILLVVDSTFMSPYLQRPLELGADIVVHSVTKYIAGHSDVLMGSVVTNSDDIVNKLRAIQNFCGAVPSPFECYLALRGLKTLHLRMDASTKNAQEIATFLESHPLVEKVLYPGLKSYPEYELAKSQTDGPGAMIALFTKGGLSVANKFLSELKLIGLAVSLGAVESLACSPALMTHTAVPLEARLAIGLTDNLIRLSVGIEHVDDLLLDLKQALDKALEFHKNGGEVKK